MFFVSNQIYFYTPSTGHHHWKTFEQLFPSLFFIDAKLLLCAAPCSPFSSPHYTLALFCPSSSPNHLLLSVQLDRHTLVELRLFTFTSSIPPPIYSSALWPTHDHHNHNIIIDNKRNSISKLTADVQCFTFFTFANRIVDFALDYFVMVGPTHVMD